MAGAVLKIAVAFATVLASADARAAGLFDHEVSTKPVASSVSQSLPAEASSIGASATLSYKALSDALNSALPQTFDASGRQRVCADLTEAIQQTVQKRIGGDVGKFLGHVVRFVTQVVTVNQTRHVCQDVDYSVQVQRTSPIAVSAGVNKVHVTTDVAVTGQAGFSGDVAKAISLDKKNFRGGIATSADISIDVDEHWCPRIQATADYRWTSRGELEIVHNVWLGIEGQVGDKLKDQLHAAITKLQSSITCASVTNAVRDIWHPYTFVIPIPSMQPSSAYATFVPSAAGFSGISYGARDLGLALSLNGALGVSTAAPSSTDVPDLPPLTRIPASSDKITIVLPATIGYDDASSALRGFLIGHAFEEDTVAGHVKVTATDVKLYPSNRKLALALSFSASTGHQIFATKGTVYLLAEPSLDTGQQTLSLKNVSVTAILDNKLWAALASLFNGQIKSFIEQRARYSLGPKIVELQAKLQTALIAEAAKQKVALTLKQDTVGLQDVRLGEKALEVVVGFAGQADLVVREIHIPAIR